MRPSASILAAFAFISTVSAEIFITAPVATTSCIAGQACTIRWNDDGKAPALKDIGPSEIALYTGGQIQQTFLQMIQPQIDVSTNAEAVFLPDASVGESGGHFFIRFNSLSLKSTTNPQFPYQSFSAKFTITGMTGTFNSTVRSQIDGVVSSASAPAPAASTPAGSVPPAAGSTSAKITTTVASSGTARSTASASAAATPNSASSIVPVAGFLTSAGTLATAAGALFGMIAFGL